MSELFDLAEAAEVNIYGGATVDGTRITYVAEKQLVTLLQLAALAREYVAAESRVAEATKARWGNAADRELYAAEDAARRESGRIWQAVKDAITANEAEKGIEGS